MFVMVNVRLNLADVSKFVTINRGSKVYKIL